MQIKEITGESIKSTSKVCLMLFKIMIPISIIMKIISELGLISYIGKILSPVMSLAGLPGSYGLAWATAMCTNNYGAILVFAKVFASEPINAAQVSTLAMMILIAHALPIETTVARKSGIRLRFSLLLRLGCALLYGMLLNSVFKIFNLLQNPPNIIWYPENTKLGITAWTVAELKNYLTIAIIVFLLITLINILKTSGIMNIIIRILQPFLKWLGIGKNAVPITIIGIVLGYSYGGGLIISEAKSGRINKKDLFYTVLFLSLCHSIIEDSLLLISIGADSIVVVFGRFFLSYLTCFVFVLFTKNMNEDIFTRLFFRPAK